MHQYTIILIEDSRDLRDLLSQSLKDRNFNVVAFASVEAARDFIFDQDEKTIVLSDVELPGKSGLEFLAEYRKAERTGPYFIMSGGNYTAEDVAAHGGTAFFSKPFATDEMIAEIMERLQKFE